MGDTWKCASHSEKRVALGTIVNTWKIGSYLKKWVKPGENVTFGKLGHILKNGLRLQICVTLKKKCATFGKMGHTQKSDYPWKNLSHWKKINHY